jgi:Uma2 family endonuclease
MLKTQDQISIELPTTIRLHVNDEQFEALARINRDLRLEKTALGELIVNPPTGGETGRRNLSLTGQLDRWYEKYENLGEAFDSSTGFILPNGAIRSPDAAWVSRERWESLIPKQKTGFVPLCPDFLVELRSPSDSLTELRAKMQEYLENGLKLGWLIDPQNKQVEIYRTRKQVEVLKSPVELSGEDILPDFVLNLKRIWG